MDYDGDEFGFSDFRSYGHYFAKVCKIMVQLPDIRDTQSAFELVDEKCG